MDKDGAKTVEIKDGAKTFEPDDGKTKIQESLKKFLIALGKWADATEKDKE